MQSKEFEQIAMQSLLPGLTFAVERAVETLNEARSALSLPLMRVESFVRRGRPPGSAGGESKPRVREEIHEAPRRKGKAKRVMSVASRRKLGASTRERWALIREAGLQSSGRVPNRAMVEKARRIIARRKHPAGAAAA